MQAVKALLRPRICTGLSGPCLLAYTINIKFVSIAGAGFVEPVHEILLLLTFSQQRMLRLTWASAQSHKSYSCSLIIQSMNADKGSALISQSMNADKGTAISRAKKLSIVVRNTLLPYIVFGKKNTKVLMRLRICAGSSESSLLVHAIITNSF